MPNLRGIPGKPWRPIASTSNNYYYLAHAQRMRRSVQVQVIIIIILRMRSACAEAWHEVGEYAQLDVGQYAAGLHREGMVLSRDLGESEFW